jgi:tRNA 5-methylaminomethyl-2-thiouridine biosynthesis bifunctional protein
MPFRLTPAVLAFDDEGTPISPAYGDIYYGPDHTHGADGASAAGQARHVFLGGNGLPARWAHAPAFTIVECGFGMGLNFLATWQAWRDDPRRCSRLHFVSVEKHPFTREDLRTLHARHPALEPLAAWLREAWPQLLPGTHRLDFDNGNVSLTLVFADAADAVAEFRCGADAFYADGFAPDRNPEMWSPQLMQGLARLARPGATLATYTTARSVRDALAAAGFVAEKRPGYGIKRDMLAARFAPRWVPHHTPPAVPQWPERRAIVIGAGLAGAAVCERLSARGWQLELIERNAAPAAETSGLHAGIFHPQPAMDDNLLARLTRAGFLFALQRWQALEAAGHPLRWQRCGVLRIAQDGDEDAQHMQAILRTLCYPETYVSCITREAASERANARLAAGGWWFPDGGWIKPSSLAAAQLAATPQLITHFGVTAQSLQREGDIWRVLDGNGKPIASASVVILANAQDATRFADFAQPLGTLRGQLTYLPGAALPGLRTVLAGGGYVIPATDGIAVAGATTDFGDHDAEQREPDHMQNLAALERLLPGSSTAFDPAALSGAVGFRCVAPDRLPMIGAVPDVATASAQSAALAGAHLPDLPRQPGLYAACAYASRGLTWAAIAGELIADLIEGTPPVLEKSLADAVDPARYVLKRVRRGEL